MPTIGDALGHCCYKIRLAIASKNKGKSGGARVITYVQVVGETVFLLAIYDKSEQASISDQQVLELLAQLPEPPQ
ncbi:MAG: type II toxin-antitoxin system RelE/ParE family toxin [Janthinobacterium lividum]